MLVYKSSAASLVQPLLLLSATLPSRGSPVSPPLSLSNSPFRFLCHASCLIFPPSRTRLLDLLPVLFHIPPPHYISDGYHPRIPPPIPPPTHSHMPTNILLAGRPSLHSLSTSSNSSPGYTHSDWQHSSPSDSWVRCDLSLSHLIRSHPLFSYKTSGSGSPSPMHNEFSPNQASIWSVLGPATPTDAGAKALSPGTSSLSSALDEDLTRPRRGRDSVSPPFSGRLSPPSPGCIRISQSCRVSPIHEVIHFRYQSRLGIPVDSLLAETRQIDHCDNLLNSPTGSTSLMHIAVSDSRVTAPSSHS